jgi:integrase
VKANPKPKVERVKVGSVSLPFYEWVDPRSGRIYYRWTWKDNEGKWRYGTRANKEEAIEAARAQARTVSNGKLDLEAITADQTDLVRQFIALNPTAADIAAMRLRRTKSADTLFPVLDSWIAHKKAELEGKESRTLNGDRLWFEKLAQHFESTKPAEITSDQLREYIEQASTNPKSRKAYRARCAMLWRFAETHELFSSKAADLLPIYKVPAREKIDILSIDQAQTLLREVADEYRAWLVLSIFSGLRAEEIHSRQESKKPSLKWQDVFLDRGIIIIPAKVSKTKKRRIIPIHSTLAEWLKLIAPPANGEICTHSPSRTETGRLGDFIGGWPRNVLRHSFGSYRAAEIDDIPKLALEMGNSVSIIESHYREAVSKEDSEQFWNLKPSEVFRKLKKDHSK